MTVPASADHTRAAVETVKACLERVAAREASVQAWEHLRPREELLAEARTAAAQGPLHGLPVAVKDVIDVAGLPTSCGTPIHAGRVAAMDAACVALLRRAGAVIMGKTVTTELGYFRPGRTRNPHDPERTPGGSSSGSAAAVAAGMAPAALGTQTTASLIRPAAFCGVVGYVATHGELPLRGIQPLAPSLDTLGIVADSVAGVRRVRAALLDGAPPPPLRPPSAPRIALWTGADTGDVEPSMRTAVDSAAAGLEAAGARIGDLPCADAVGELTALHGEVLAFEAARSLAPEAATPERLGPELRALIDAGRTQTYAAHRAVRARAEVAAAPVRRALADVDAVLAPAALGPAPRGLGSTGSPVLSRVWQLLGLPAVALPAARDPDGMPLGVQLVGAAHADDALLALAASVQEAITPG